MNRALADLMGEGRQDPIVRAKFDTERLRRLVILYCNRMRRAMASPRSCYFTGERSIYYIRGGYLGKSQNMLLFAWKCSYSHVTSSKCTQPSFKLMLTL